jgi:multidrug efflux pump subunit AcrB
VATVTDTVAERRSAALLNGAPVVGFEITRSRGASEVEVDAAVTRVLATLRTAHPDLRIDQAFNMVDPVVDNYDGSMVLLYEGALLAVLVVWFFLRDWRATFVARWRCRCRWCRPSSACGGWASRSTWSRC